MMSPSAVPIGAELEQLEPPMMRARSGAQRGLACRGLHLRQHAACAGRTRCAGARLSWRVRRADRDELPCRA